MQGKSPAKNVLVGAWVSTLLCAACLPALADNPKPDSARTIPLLGEDAEETPKKNPRKAHPRHGVTCFGVTNAASRDILEFGLNSQWNLPPANESYLVVASFQILKVGKIGTISVVQSSGIPQIDDGTIATIKAAQEQINSNLRVVRDTEV